MIFAAAFVFATATAAPTASPAPSPSPQAAGKRTLKLDIPPGWQRTESGQYNEWRSPDGMANFRVAVMPMSDDLRGPNAADAVKAQFQAIAGRFNKNAQISVKTVQVCNGEQTAYRVDDPLGVGSAGFMMIIPGTDSSGLVNYEIMGPAKADAGILAAVDKICWP